MKAYIKPNIKMADMESEALLANSIGSTTGLEDVTVSGQEFEGGNADSRRRSVWDDDEE